MKARGLSWHPGAVSSMRRASICAEYQWHLLKTTDQHQRALPTSRFLDELTFILPVLSMMAQTASPCSFFARRALVGLQQLSCAVA